MGACCSAGARDRHDNNIMPAPQAQDRPRSGLSKLQSLRQQVQSRHTAPQKSRSANQTESPLLNDNQRNNNCPARSSTSIPQHSTSSRSDTNANPTTGGRFGFGFRKPSNDKQENKSLPNSRKGSQESLEVKKSSGRITPSSSTGSLNKPDRKPLITKSQNSSTRSSSTRSSTSSLNTTRPQSPSVLKRPPSPSVVRRPPSPSVGKRAPSPSGLKRPPSPSVGKRPPSPSVGKRPPSPSVIKRPPSPSVTKKSVGSRLPGSRKNSNDDGKVSAPVDNKSAPVEEGYKSSRQPAQARGPLSRLAQSKNEQFSSLPRGVKYQKESQKSESKFGFRTAKVPNQLNLNKRQSLDCSNNTPDSMTESIFNPEAPLATFDSLGSTSFMSQISMGSDDMILDFDEDGFASVASTPGDDKNLEKEFSTSSLRRPRSKSIEALRKKAMRKSPLVIDSTDDSAYNSANSEKLESTIVSGTFISQCPLSPVLDVSTDTASLDDADKTLSSNSLDCKSPVKTKEENGNYEFPEAEVKSEICDARVKYRSRPRAATLQELTELISETSPTKESLQRTRSLSSPLKPPRPRSMSGVEEEDMVMVDPHVYRQAMQDITTFKTMLHKLKRCLHEDDMGLIELAEQRRTLRSSSFGSEGSLLDDCPLRRKSSQRSNPDTPRSTDTSPRERHPSLSENELVEENYELRQLVSALRRDVDERDHTIHLLQLQMTKYETETKRPSTHSSTQTEPTPSRQDKPAAVDCRSEPPRSKLVKPSTLPQPKSSLQQSNSVSDILAEISRKSNEEANLFGRKLNRMKNSLTDLNDQLRCISQNKSLRHGSSLSRLPNCTDLQA